MALCKTSLSERDNSLPMIPVDLLMEIFSRLPAKSIARCRCVSKLWASMLRTPDFTDLFFIRSSARQQLLLTCQKIYGRKLLLFSAPHQVQNSLISANYLTSYTYDYDKFSEFRGFVRGLFCYEQTPRLPWSHCDRLMVICNPSTGQSITRRIQMDGFLGYDPVGKEFKLLSMTMTSVYEVSAQVLTLGTDEKPSWRKIECGIPHYRSRGKGICINGVLYYQAEVTFSRDPIIICFDVRTEKYSFVKPQIPRGGAQITLINYYGKLASLMESERSSYISEESKSFDMCVLQDPEKHEWSKHVYEFPPKWTRMRNVVLYFVGLTGTNEILFSPSSVHENLLCVYYYNIKSKTMRRAEIQVGAFKYGRVHISLDHVEDVNLMEMFKG